MIQALRGVIVVLLAGQATFSVAQDKATLPEHLPFDRETLTADAAGSSVRPPLDVKAARPVYIISGETTARREAELSFRVGGYVKSLRVKAGMTLKAGEVLAELDDFDYQRAYELASAQLHQAKVQAEAARKEHQREQELKNQNASSLASYDRAWTAFQQAKISVTLAEINVKNAKQNLDHTKLYAPYDCTVAETHKNEAEHVGQGTTVVKIFEADTIEVTLEVPERLVGEVTSGDELQVRIPSLAFSGKAQVVRVVPYVSDKTRSFKVSAVFVTGNPRMVPGLFAEAQLY